ncbi:MAG TPA: hypothetical protein VEJ20_08905, partial [Candidatus Eremiobacteraceae bacterium]|nr:hypothetical protein [Candidatus Eremiobacteraceae bacterium]
MTVLRTAVVVAVSAFMICVTVPNIWVPIGANLPITVNYHYDVVNATSGPVLDAMGIRIGDHVIPSSTTLPVKEALLGIYLQRAGESLHFTVERDGVPHPITVPPPIIGGGSFITALIKRTAATLFVIVAATLLLMRPSPMLWGFWLFAIGSVDGSPLVLEFVTPSFGAAVGSILFDVYGVLGPLGLVMFATRFPASDSTGFRALVQRATPALALLLVAGVVPQMLFTFGVATPPFTFDFSTIVLTAVVSLGSVTLLAGFIHAQPAQRQRLRWVVAGFAVYWAYLLYFYLSNNYLPSQGWPPAWTNAGITNDVLNGLVIFIPVTVAYAVLKHHVLDINFVLERGIVYGIVTTVAVGVFAIADWLLHRAVAQTNLAFTGEIAAALAIGFGLNGLHSHVDRFVDSFIFRSRHIAEE